MYQTQIFGVSRLASMRVMVASRSHDDLVEYGQNPTDAVVQMLRSPALSMVEWRRSSRQWEACLRTLMSLIRSIPGS